MKNQQQEVGVRADSAAGGVSDVEEESDGGSDSEKEQEQEENLEDTLLPANIPLEEQNEYQVKILEDDVEDEIGQSTDKLSKLGRSFEKLASRETLDEKESQAGDDDREDEPVPTKPVVTRRQSSQKMNADEILHQLQAMNKKRDSHSDVYCESGGMAESNVDVSSRQGDKLSPLEEDLAMLSHLPFYKIALIYYAAPVTKFCMHTIAYVIFLLIFTRSTMETGKGMRSVWGMLSFQFMICYALEAYRQLVTQRAAWKMKLKIWAMSEWNIIELTYLSMGLISFPLTAWEATRLTAITINCIIVVLMWIRLLRFYQCSSKLGPMWIMIRKMMAETMYFMAIFGVLVISCGICIFSINVAHEEDRGHYWQGKSYVFIRPYLMFLGNQFLEWTYEGRNPRLTVITCFFFVVVGNALMLNLLVAIYGGIFNEIVDKSDVEWKTEMYWLMKDFSSKTFLPPPISILETIMSWGYYICWGRFKTAPPMDKHEEQLVETLEILESYCVDNVMKHRESMRDSLDITNTTIRALEVSTGKIMETIETVEEMRKEVENKKLIEAEKRREEFRKQHLK